MELAERVQLLLTQRLAAYCLNIADGRTIGEFARDEKIPDGLMIEKMEKLITISSVIEKEGGAKLTQLWFLGSNDFLGLSPAEMLRNDFHGHYEEVLASAHALCES